MHDTWYRYPGGTRVVRLSKSAARVPGRTELTAEWLGSGTMRSWTTGARWRRHGPLTQRGLGLLLGRSMPRTYGLLGFRSSTAWWAPGTRRSRSTRPSSPRSTRGIPAHHLGGARQHDRVGDGRPRRRTRGEGVPRAQTGPERRSREADRADQAGRDCVTAAQVTIAGIEAWVAATLGEDGRRELRRLLLGPLKEGSTCRGARRTKTHSRLPADT